MNNNILIGIGLIASFIGYRFLNKSDSGYEYSKTTGGLTKQQAQIYSDLLFQSMKDIGTADVTIDNVYEEIKDIPRAFNDISACFAKKGHFLTGISGLLGWELNLFGWVKEEISSSRLEKWRLLMNQ